MSRSLLPLNLPRRLRDKVLGFCWGPLGVTFVFVLALLWSFWTTLAAMVDRWSRDPQYSHGFLIPIFALIVLRFRRDRLTTVTGEPSFLGLPLLLAGTLLRLYAIRRDIVPLDAFALLPTLFGLVLLVGGRSVLRWSWPALAFLGFMIPLPFFLEVAALLPLQHVATAMSTYLLQTFGYPAIAEGNVILIDQVRLGVVEACSGLKMLMTFLALSTALALISQAPLWHRIALVVSAVPIAVIANVARITVTGMVYHGLGSEDTQAILHDLSGWLMPPLAFFVLWLELRFLGKLFVPREEPAGDAAVVPGLTLTAR
jgi:exosortase